MDSQGKPDEVHIQHMKKEIIKNCLDMHFKFNQRAESILKSKEGDYDEFGDTLCDIFKLSIKKLEEIIRGIYGINFVNRLDGARDYWSFDRVKKYDTETDLDHKVRFERFLEENKPTFLQCIYDTATNENQSIELKVPNDSDFCFGSKQGRPCREKPLEGSSYCFSHSPLDINSNYTYCKHNSVKREDQKCYTPVLKGGDPYCSIHKIPGGHDYNKDMKGQREREQNRNRERVPHPERERERERDHRTRDLKSSRDRERDMRERTPHPDFKGQRLINGNIAYNNNNFNHGVKIGGSILKGPKNPNSSRPSGKVFKLSELPVSTNFFDPNLPIYQPPPPPQPPPLEPQQYAYQYSPPPPPIHEIPYQAPLSPPETYGSTMSIPFSQQDAFQYSPPLHQSQSSTYPLNNNNNNNNSHDSITKNNNINLNGSTSGMYNNNNNKINNNNNINSNNMGMNNSHDRITSNSNINLKGTSGVYNNINLNNNNNNNHNNNNNNMNPLQTSTNGINSPPSSSNNSPDPIHMISDTNNNNINNNNNNSTNGNIRHHPYKYNGIVEKRDSFDKFEGIEYLKDLEDYKSLVDPRKILYILDTYDSDLMRKLIRLDEQSKYVLLKMSEYELYYKKKDSDHGFIKKEKI